ncbi:MAG: hypothetical protein RJA09_184 [Pseudomonadota bacterium]|jgi:predicted MFS family arabinose efflux permease
MTPLERRTSAALASVFALRMLGLFMVLPVFALEASRYPGGDDPALVGLAMGVYGLTQALLQMPMGMASDRWGRKPVILVGLFLFAVGSALSAWAPTLDWLVVGRTLQGAGAISAAVTALLADLTRDSVRTKSMAMVGISIALVFALSLVASPWLASLVGLAGLFALTAGLALAGMAVVVWLVPPEPPHKPLPSRQGWVGVLKDPNLLRLNLGVFVLHAVQLAMWVGVPALLVTAGLPKADHWQVYLPAVVASFLIMGSVLFRLERQGHLKTVFLVSIGLLLLAQLGLLFEAGAPSVWGLGLLLFCFFLGFNTLEASQPSLVSRLAPADARGAALGVYNTLQSIGFFVGGALGGWLAKTSGPTGLYAGCAALVAVWLWVAWGMKAPAVVKPAAAASPI